LQFLLQNYLSQQQKKKQIAYGKNPLIKESNIGNAKEQELNETQIK
jgi:hypothetical protein